MTAQSKPVNPGVPRASSAPEIRLLRRPLEQVPFTPDADQAKVIAHSGSPLLVFGAPGTGKTRTLIESVVTRINKG